MGTIGFGAAFVAGLVSFLSPCVLPLVPGYISMISGLSLAELAGGAEGGTAGRRAGGAAAVFFVLGFSAVFVALGATATVLGQALIAYQTVLSRIAGVVVVLFGLHLSGLLPLAALYREMRFNASSVKAGWGGAFLMGMAFAFGWSPCIGPILGAILALAATRDTVWHGVALLAVYSLGLGIPFLLAGLAVDKLTALTARYRRWIRWGEVAAGVLLMAIGVMIFMEKTTWLIRFLPSSLKRFQL